MGNISDHLMEAKVQGHGEESMRNKGLGIQKGEHGQRAFRVGTNGRRDIQDRDEWQLRRNSRIQKVIP